MQLPTKILIIITLRLIVRHVHGSSLYKHLEQYQQPEPHLTEQDAKYWLSNAEKYLLKALDINRNKVEENVAKNVIVFIGDGMGMSTITASRIHKGQQLGNSGENENLTFDLFPNVGLAKTYNVDKQVPDSAGTATAIFTGVKTNSGVLGYDGSVNVSTSLNDIEKHRLTSIMDWAIVAKKRTGFVTTTRLTHATPAALYAHSMHRDWECDSKVPMDKRMYIKDIARQLVEDSPGNKLNVILAGGTYTMGSNEQQPIRTTEAFGEPPEFGGSFEKFCKRTDNRNLINEWLNLTSNRRAYVTNTGQLMATSAADTEFLLGLFASNHMTYSSLRDRSESGEPSVMQMTEKAIEILNFNNSHGFVLIIEGGRIDQAHHQNHARLALEEVIELDLAIQRTLEMINLNETIILVTADHSHALTINGYQKRGNSILGFGNKPNTEPYETLTYANGPGFWTHRLQTDKQNFSEIGRYDTWLKMNQFPNAVRMLPTYRHQAMFPLEDGTHGGEDIPVYAIGTNAQLISGVFEQNYIGFMLSYVSCMGPASYLNDNCNSKPKQEANVKSSSNATNYLIQLLIVCFMFGKLY